MVLAVADTPVRVVARSEAVDWRAGTRTYLHAGQAVGSEQICVFEQFHEPGGGAPPHSHPGIEETVTVLAGQARFEVEGQEAVVDAVATVIVPAGVEHSFSNVGSETLWVIAALPAAVPQVEYLSNSGVVLEIGREGGARHDAHRSYRED